MTLQGKSKLPEIEQGFANMKAGKTQRSGIVLAVERFTSPALCGER